MLMKVHVHMGSKRQGLASARASSRRPKQNAETGSRSKVKYQLGASLLILGSHAIHNDEYDGIQNPTPCYSYGHVLTEQNKVRIIKMSYKCFNRIFIQCYHFHYKYYAHAPIQYL